MEEFFKFEPVYIIDDELIVSTMAACGIHIQDFGMYKRGKVFYIYAKTPEIEKALEEFRQNTLMVKAQDFWLAHSQPGVDASDFNAGG